MLGRPTRRRARLAAAALLLAALPAAPAAAAGDPIMPLSQVSHGMRCTGYTVLRGTDISSFDVEVIDVVAGDAAGRQPLILVRVSGPAVEGLGIGEGFSGSPIYCPDAQGTQRVIGAIAYGSGDYGNNVGLAQPIESMLGLPVRPPTGTRLDPRVRHAKALAGPLTVSGLAPEVAGPLQRLARRAGRSLAVAPIAPVGDVFPVQVLRPGSSLAVGISSGDIGVGALGTVTYVDGSTVYGFGHPLDGAGRRSLFLQDGYVYTTIGNPIDSGQQVTQKIGAPGHDLGALTSDGRTGVVGVVGALPPHTALHVSSQDADTGAKQEVLDVSVADETDVGLPLGVTALGFVVPLAVAQAAYTTLDASPVLQSDSLCLKITLRERAAPMGFCNSYVGGFGGTGGDSGSLPGGPFLSDIGEALTDVDAYNFSTPHVSRVDVDLLMARGLRQSFITRVRAPKVLRAGQDFTLSLSLQRVRGLASVRTVRAHVPAGLGSGRRTLVVTGTPSDTSGSSTDLTSLLGGGAGSASSPPDEAGPRSLSALAHELAAIHRFDGVIVSFRSPGAKDDVTGRHDPAAPRPLLSDPNLRISGTAKTRVTIR